MKKRYYVLFEGQVQGVGFRFTLMMKASELNINGSVKNLDNGNVEAYLEGEEKDLLTLIRFMCQNQRFIRVNNYYIKEVAIKNDNDFKILY